MKMISRLFAAFAILSHLIGSASASGDLEDGWVVIYKRDSFDRVIVPIISIRELGDDFTKASLLLACNEDKKLVAFFQPGEIMLTVESIKVSFRAGDAVQDYVFEPQKVGRLSTVRAITPQETQDLIAMFEGAGGSPVAFRTERKQGQLPSVAAAKVFKILKDECSDS